MHQHPQRIGIETPAQFTQLHARLLGGGDIEARGRQKGPTGIEMEPGDIELHALDETFDVGDAGEADTVPAGQIGGVDVIGIKTQHGRAVEPESDGGHTAIEVRENLSIGHGGIGMRVLLADVPPSQRVAEQLRAAHERGIARQSGRVASGGKRLLGIERL